MVWYKKLYIRLRQRWESAILDYHARRDLPRLQTLLPVLVEAPERWVKQEAFLRPFYDSYIREISRPTMAVSLPTAVLLTLLAQTYRPQRILDLGSGFSSFTLRTYAAQASPTPVVYSVDDDESWLAKTAVYLTGQRLATDHLLSWAHFSGQAQPPFDLIFHDLGRMPTRKESLPQVVNLLAPDGLLVLDDMHKWHYRPVVRRALAPHNLTLCSTRTYTRDPISRHAEIAARFPLDKK